MLPSGSLDEFADQRGRLGARSMIIMGAGICQWFHGDATYRAILSMLLLTGSMGRNGGGWVHYVGQEKCRPYPTPPAHYPTGERRVATTTARTRQRRRRCGGDERQCMRKTEWEDAAALTNGQIFPDQEALAVN